MKKTMIGSALALGLIMSGAGVTSANSNIGGAQPINIQGMDIETALMAVQSQRAKLLEEQLRNQIEDVQQKNQGIATLNNQLIELNKEKAATSDQAKQAELEKQINDLKGQIDSLGNSQQMDMLRLQSMSNKRNEAFDVMTNFVKKMQDSRSSILGNMR
ncbi:hypothetical protein [Bacillus ndiopicus]|uniref:hypothetical protein n=1 Tax=Bacillus ndiopicus TaxID=1347368 RepID=UPI0005A8DD17|nr:hypothetical protein [Bacillus ndiopicus]